MTIWRVNRRKKKDQKYRKDYKIHMVSKNRPHTQIVGFTGGVKKYMGTKEYLRG